MLERFRSRLASVDALPQLAILGLVSGLLAGAVIVVFRLLIENIQTGFLPAGDVENYEALSATTRFMLPAIGGLVIGIVFQLMSHTGSVQVGIVHVLERLSYNQGHLPLRNFILQFVGAGLSIISGHSVGREGPGVHLGAASGSLLGQRLNLPNNSIQILVACGAAASIAASFNTPLAGVIFAMEVIMMEYTIAGFTPVILSAVSATALTRLVFGAEPAFTLPTLQLNSLLELPYLLVMGLVVGALAAIFTSSLKWTTEISRNMAIWQRMSLAGIITGLIALLVPEVMGIGYDTVNQALLGQVGMGLLILIILFKLAATTIGLGLGLPGGLIGPTLVIGAAVGGVLGLLADLLYPGQVASSGFYAMLGMGAMMGATLQAPLAALVALLELTANPNIILPGMLVIIASGITSSHLFRTQSVFLTLSKARGLDYRSNPVAQSLRRIGVASVMEVSFVETENRINVDGATSILSNTPHWIVVRQDNNPAALLLAADLSRYLNDPEEDVTEKLQDEGGIDLLEIPAHRENIVTITEQATLQQALDTMNEKNVDALCVAIKQYHINPAIVGIITRQTVESQYHNVNNT
ncbi:chloride channel protein [Kaarinaea lacus]